MLEWLFGSGSEEVPEWRIRERQMTQAQTHPPFSGQAQWLEYEQRMLTKARDLVSGCDPAYNIAPVLDLVKQADRMGFNLVRRS